MVVDLERHKTTRGLNFFDNRLREITANPSSLSNSFTLVPVAEYSSTCARGIRLEDMEDAYLRETGEVLQHFGVLDRARGLSEEQVKKSREQHGKNGQ